MFDILEGIVSLDADAMGIENQRITGNTGRFLVSLAETAVNADFLTAGPNRGIALGHLYRRMSVDDVGLGRIQTEFMQHLFTDFLLPVQLVIGILGLRPGAFVVDVTAFKGLDGTSRHRGIGMDPQEPEKVLVFQLTPPEADTGQMIHPVHVGTALQGLPTQGDRPEGAVLVHGQPAVEHQVAVHDLVQGAVAEEEVHMLLQGLAVQEIPLPVFDDLLFFRRILIGTVRIVGRKVRGVHFILTVR